MRKYLYKENLLDKVVDLKHYQAFNAMTYTTIVILCKNKRTTDVAYYQFNAETRKPYLIETLSKNDYYISGNYYFAKKDDLSLLSKIFKNYGSCDIQVKNGYATLCDSVFISDFDFESSLIIPVIKVSKGLFKKIIYPYDRNAKLISEDEIKKDKNVYAYLLKHKEDLTKRSNEKGEDKYWYAFGRSQALIDTYIDRYL